MYTGLLGLSSGFSHWCLMPAARTDGPLVLSLSLVYLWLYEQAWIVERSPTSPSEKLSHGHIHLTGFRPKRFMKTKTRSQLKSL